MNWTPARSMLRPSGATRTFVSVSTTRLTQTTTSIGRSLGGLECSGSAPPRQSHRRRRAGGRRGHRGPKRGPPELSLLFRDPGWSPFRGRETIVRAVTPFDALRADEVSGLELGHREALAEVRAAHDLVAHERGRRAVPQDLPVRDDVGAVRHRERLAHVVVGEQDSDPLLPAEPAQ